MELNEFLEYTKQACNFLEQEGYTLRNVDTSANRNFRYEKHADTEGFRISFAWTKYGDEYYVRGIQALKRFNEVEKPIQEILGGELNDYYTIYKDHSPEIIQEKPSIQTTEENMDFVLKNMDDIFLFSEFIKRFYNLEAKMFFDTFKTIINVDEWLKSNDLDKHKNFIVVWDNTMMIRKLFLMRFAHDENFNNLYSRYKSFLEQKNREKESPYVQMFAIFTKFEKYFN